MSAFEADRFNRSRTSPKSSSQLSAVSSLQVLAHPAGAEELLQKLCATVCKHAIPNFHVMVHARVVEDSHHRMHGTRFGVVRTVDQAPNPRVDERSRAHGARLNCNKQLTVAQAMITDRGTR